MQNQLYAAHRQALLGGLPTAIIARLTPHCSSHDPHHSTESPHHCHYGVDTYCLHCHVIALPADELAAIQKRNPQLHVKTATQIAYPDFVRLLRSTKVFISPLGCVPSCHKLAHVLW